MIYTTHITSKKRVAEGTLEITFERPESFTYVSGQYLQLAVKTLRYTDPKGASRLFSICSSPRTDKEMSVVFRETGSGFKKTLAELPIGAEILFEGPFGFFTLPQETTSQHVFVAGGIGIAPFLSMIRTSVGSSTPHTITLIYANTNKERTAYLDALTKMSNHHSHFSLKLVFGRVDTVYISECMKQVDAHAQWWVVGPPGMVSETKLIIESLGVPGNHIRVEEFVGY